MFVGARDSIGSVGASGGQRIEDVLARQTEEFLREKKAQLGASFNEKAILMDLLNRIRRHKSLPFKVSVEAMPVLQHVVESKLFGARDPEQERKVDAFIQPLLDRGCFQGSVLMVREGVACVRKSYGSADTAHRVPNTTDTRFGIASLSKQFTAAAIMILQERGMLNVHDTVSKFLPGFPHAEEITIEQLLRHTSGIPSFPGPDFPGFDDTVPRNPDEIVRIIQGRMAEKQAAKPGSELDFPVGAASGYSNSGYVLLASIIERVSGKSYAEFVTDNIFRPLGMQNSGLEMAGDGPVAKGHRLEDESLVPIPKDTSFIPGAGGRGFLTTVEDLYLWDQELQKTMTDPSHRGVLSQVSLSAMYTPGGAPCFDKRTRIITARPSDYGYGSINAPCIGHPTSVHTGGCAGFGSAFGRALDTNATLILLTNGGDPYDKELTQLALGETVPPLPQAALPRERAGAPTELMRSCAGTYDDHAPDGRLVRHKITYDAGRFYMQVNDQPKFTIRPESETIFFRKTDPIKFEFVPSADQKSIESMRIIFSDGHTAIAQRVEPRIIIEQRLRQPG